MYPPVLASIRGSDNPRGADNQQERLTIRGQNPQRLHARPLIRVDDIVRSSWRHEEPDGNDLAGPTNRVGQVTTMNGPKVGSAALVKFGYMLETPRILQYSPHHEAVTICEVRTISRKD